MPRKIKWNNGDIFAIPLLNGKFCVGQILDLQMTNIVRIALYDEVMNEVDGKGAAELCNPANLISLIATSKEQLDYNVWKILGNKEQKIPFTRFPNEQYRNNGWVGAKSYDAALAEDFVNSYYGLLPWDDWFNPNYLDQFLVDISKKPQQLIYLKK